MPLRGAYNSIHLPAQWQLRTPTKELDPYEQELQRFIDVQDYRLRKFAEKAFLARDERDALEILTDQLTKWEKQRRERPTLQQPEPVWFSAKINRVLQLQKDLSTLEKAPDSRLKTTASKLLIFQAEKLLQELQESDPNAFAKERTNEEWTNYMLYNRSNYDPIKAAFGEAFIRWPLPYIPGEISIKLPSELKADNDPAQRALRKQRTEYLKTVAKKLGDYLNNNRIEINHSDSEAQEKYNRIKAILETEQNDQSFNKAFVKLAANNFFDDTESALTHETKSLQQIVHHKNFSQLKKDHLRAYLIENPLSVDLIETTLGYDTLLHEVLREPAIALAIKQAQAEVATKASSDIQERLDDSDKRYKEIEEILQEKGQELISMRARLQEAQSDADNAYEALVDAYKQLKDEQVRLQRSLEVKQLAEGYKQGRQESSEKNKLYASDIALLFGSDHFGPVNTPEAIVTVAQEEEAKKTASQQNRLQELNTLPTTLPASHEALAEELRLLKPTLVERYTTALIKFSRLKKEKSRMVHGIYELENDKVVVATVIAQNKATLQAIEERQKVLAQEQITLRNQQALENEQRYKTRGAVIGAGIPLLLSGTAGGATYLLLHKHLKKGHHSRVAARTKRNRNALIGAYERRSKKGRISKLELLPYEPA
jgi:hypothetical protein